MKVFTTRNTLTHGCVIEMEVSGPFNDGLIVVVVGTGETFGHREWFMTREDAIADCELRRERKVRTIEHNLARLKALVFE